jgi:hypothetical protein
LTGSGGLDSSAANAGEVSSAIAAELKVAVSARRLNMDGLAAENWWPTKCSAPRGLARAGAPKSPTSRASRLTIAEVE